MIEQLPARDTRERQILAKAIEAFAAHGVRGTSLRDIARDANVSLTLISHHFGNKPSLVAAAAEQIRLTCAPALVRLRAKLDRMAGFDTALLAEAWVDYFEDAFGSVARLPHLRLMHRLSTDPSVERSVCASFEIAESWLRRPLKTAFPRAPDASIDLVLRLLHSALVTSFLEDLTVHAGDVVRSATRRALLVNFVSAAMDGTLGGGRPDSLEAASTRKSATAPFQPANCSPA